MLFSSAFLALFCGLGLAQIFPNETNPSNTPHSKQIEIIHRVDKLQSQTPTPNVGTIEKLSSLRIYDLYRMIQIQQGLLTPERAKNWLSTKELNRIGKTSSLLEAYQDAARSIYCGEIIEGRGLALAENLERASGMLGTILSRLSAPISALSSALFRNTPTYSSFPIPEKPFLTWKSFFKSITSSLTQIALTFGPLPREALPPLFNSVERELFQNYVNQYSLQGITPQEVQLLKNSGNYHRLVNAIKSARYERKRQSFNISFNLPLFEKRITAKGTTYNIFRSLQKSREKFFRALKVTTYALSLALLTPEIGLKKIEFIPQEEFFSRPVQKPTSVYQAGQVAPVMFLIDVNTPVTHAALWIQGRVFNYSSTSMDIFSAREAFSRPGADIGSLLHWSKPKDSTQADTNAAQVNVLAVPIPDLSPNEIAALESYLSLHQYTDYPHDDFNLNCASMIRDALEKTTHYKFPLVIKNSPSMLGLYFSTLGAFDRDSQAYLITPKPMSSLRAGTTTLWALYQESVFMQQPLPMIFQKLQNEISGVDRVTLQGTAYDQFHTLSQGALESILESSQQASDEFAADLYVQAAYRAKSEGRTLSTNSQTKVQNQIQLKYDDYAKAYKDTRSIESFFQLIAAQWIAQKIVEDLDLKGNFEIPAPLSEAETTARNFLIRSVRNHLETSVKDDKAKVIHSPHP